MTIQRTKEISVMLWTKLANTGGWDRSKATFELFRDNKITTAEYELMSKSLGCVICSYKREHKLKCADICPLVLGTEFVNCTADNAIYLRWSIEGQKEKRKKAAKDILEKIEAWEV